jgi:hypothetical protein
LKVAWEQARNAAVVIYSVGIMATVIPGFAHVPNLIVILYFFLVPGYFVTLLLRETGTILERVFYSIAWSLVILVSVLSLESLEPQYQFIRTDLAVPVLTIVLLAIDHFLSR